MAARRRRGEDGISFEHRGGPCRDSERHRHCAGLWRGEVTLGYTEDGKRDRRKVSGQTKAAVLDKLRELHKDLDKGIIPKAGYAHYTVRQAAEDWLANGLDGRSAKTIKKNQNVLEPILKVVGARKLRELSAAEVRQALSKMSTGYSSAAVTMGHLALKRAIRHAEANDLVSRNVAALVDTPKGQEGRPSKSLTLEQAVRVITAAETLPVMELRPGLKDVRRPAALMYASIILSLLLGVRTEAARALLEGQADERLLAGEKWQDTGLVFTTHLGTALDAGNVRKMFKRVCKAAGIADSWTPRELRTSFVSLMSHRGVSIEEIARLVGHASTRTTEVV